MSVTPDDTSAPPDARLQLADLTIDLVGARVTRGPDEIALPRLSWDLLKVLLELAPGMVTTETLLARVWPGLVVNPETVSQRVKLLRMALGDDPRQPRYIAVVRGRGYRLAAPVVRLAADVALVPAPAVVVTESTGIRLRLPATAAVLIALVAFGGILAWQASREQQVSGPTTSALAVNNRSIAVLQFEALGSGAEDKALALDIAEAVWSQLGTLHDMSVIDRNSSFAAEIASLDVRSAGARLGVAYLLRGSVQRIDSQVRITVQLIDTTSGESRPLQFNLDTRDFFAVSDEIALKVAQELELSLDAATRQQAGLGTTSDDARMEFSLARSLLRDGRLTDLEAAKQHLELAIEQDASFEEAYVELGAAVLRQAEFDQTGNRRVAFEAAKRAAGQLFDKAIAINPDYGQARLQRAHLIAYSDPEAAEAEYLLGLSMEPSDAAGYEGLAAAIYQNPERHSEVIDALDRARHLDPLQPRYDITKASFLFNARGDLAGAHSLVKKVLQEHPRNAPAQNRMAGLMVAQGQLARGIRHNELALDIDPSFDWARRQLISLYADLGETRAARDVLSKAATDIPARELTLLVEDANWRAAGERAYAALDADTVLAYDEPVVALALRRHARVTREIDSALAELESLAELRWNSDGEPEFPDFTDMRLYVAGVGDLLLLDGQLDRGRQVLLRLLGQVEEARVSMQRAGYWTHQARAVALALLGDAEGAMRALHKSLDDGLLPQRHRQFLDLEPAFDGLRGREDFRALQAKVERVVRKEKADLQKLRRDELVPSR